MEIRCDWCGRSFEKSNGHINRARKMGQRLFCNRTCAGLGRRVERTIAQKKEIKRLYDIEYRKDNECLKAKKKNYNETAQGRAMQKKNRDKRKKQHLAYCRTEEYKKWKQEYDKKHVAIASYGEFWESAITLREIDKEIAPEIYKVRIEKGYYNKAQKRKRLWNSMRRTLNKHYGTP